jgi:hypothetical protein
MSVSKRSVPRRREPIESKTVFLGLTCCSERTCERAPPSPRRFLYHDELLIYIGSSGNVCIWIYKKLLVSYPNPAQWSSVTCFDNVVHSLRVFVFPVYKQHCVHLAFLEFVYWNVWQYLQPQRSEVTDLLPHFWEADLFSSPGSFRPTSQFHLVVESQRQKEIWHSTNTSA